MGQAPSRTEDPATPLEGRVGKRLSELFGCTYDEYIRETQRFNILPEWPGAAAKGDKFPMAVARMNASRMASSFCGCRVLFLGVGVAKAFGFSGQVAKWMRCACHSGVYWAAVLPHVSGINRWWNLTSNNVQARRFMRATWRRLHA